jgi:glutaredoxin
MSSRLIIFTLDGCDHCLSLKMRLNKLTIPYKEIEITKNPEIWNQLVDATGNEMLPLVFISNENEDEGELFAPETDYQSEDEIVEIIKSKFLKKEG